MNCENIGTLGHLTVSKTRFPQVGLSWDLIGLCYIKLVLWLGGKYSTALGMRKLLSVKFLKRKRRTFIYSTVFIQGIHLFLQQEKKLSGNLNFQVPRSFFVKVFLVNSLSLIKKTFLYKTLENHNSGYQSITTSFCLKFFPLCIITAALLTESKISELAIEDQLTVMI